MSIRSSLGHVDLGPDFWGRFKDKKPRSSKCEDFDDILDIIGSQGKFQKLLLYAVLGPVTLLVPLMMFNIVFMLYEPEHYCFVPGRNETMDELVWKNLTIPKEPGPDGKIRYSQCNMYDPTGKVVKCQHGWVYDRTDYADTLPSQFDWVCDHSYYSTYALTLASGGNAVGTIIFGPLADKLGRKPIFFFLCFLNVATRISSLFVAEHILWFFVHQVVNGMAFPLMYIVSTMIVCEVSNKEYRAWVYSFTWMIWVVGFSVLPFLAWITRTWFYMGLATSVPGIFLFFYFWWIPESPRWLISKGKIAEAKEVIHQIAKTNKTQDQISSQTLDFMVTALAGQQHDESKKSPGLLTIFKRGRLAKNTIMITIMWITNNVVNFGITLNANTLEGNQFINFFILAITEVPSAYIGGILANGIGRRWTQVLFYLLTTVTCAGAGFGTLWCNYSYVIISFVVGAKFAITLTFLVVYIQVTEIFPTQLRSTGSGFASTVGSAMTIMAPYIVYLGKLNVAAPYLFLAGVSLLGTMAAFFTPETLNQNLPETVDEANMLGKNESLWSFCPYGRSSKSKEENTKC